MTSYVSLVWGNNVCKQGQKLGLDGSHIIICCPKSVKLAVRVKNVKFNFSGILIETESSWKFYGKFEKFLNDQEVAFLSSKENKIDISEKRLLAASPPGNIFVKNGFDPLKNLKLQFNNDNTEAAAENKISQIAVEDNSALIVNEDGKLFSSNIEVFLPGIKVTNATVGKEHCMVLSQEGIVYTWGSNMRGQLGHENLHQVDNPAAIETLQGINILSICCGGWHSTALSDSGDAYVWGWNDVGQLGFPSRMLRSGGVKWDLDLIQHECQCRPSSDDSTYLAENAAARKSAQQNINLERSSDLINVQFTPKLLDFWNTGVCIRKIACGTRHTAFLLDDQSLWTCGWNRYGQLGIGSTESKDEPQLVTLSPVSDVFAGSWNTFATQEKKNSCGKNS